MPTTSPPQQPQQPQPSASDLSTAEVRPLLDSLPDAATVADSAWRVVYLNPAAAEIVRAMGRSLDSVLGVSLWEAFPTLRDTRVERELRRAVAEHQTVGYEESFGENGARYESRAVPIRDGVIIYSRDVTARRAAEAALRRSEERFRLAQESSPDAFAIFRSVRDDAGAIVDFEWDYANPAALRVQNATLEELRGQRLLARNPGVVGDGLYAGYLATASTGVPYETEIHYRHEWIDTWFRISAVQLGDGFALTFSDITRRKIAEQRTTQLANLTGALAGALTEEQVAAVVFDGILPAIGARQAAVVRFDAASNEFQLVAAKGWGEEMATAWRRYTPERGTPGADAVRTRRGVFIANEQDWATSYPLIAGVARRLGMTSNACMPLLIAGEPRGVISIASPEPHRFDHEERQFLTAIADQVAQALERVRLLEAERVARADLTRVFSQAPVAMALVTGPAHVYRVANPRYLEIIGRGHQPDSSIVGRTVRDALPELEGQGIFELLDDVYRNGYPFVGNETRVTLMRGEGGASEEGFFNFVFQPITDAGGAVTGIAIVATDVTQQVRARLEAEQLREAADASNAAKMQFLANMSHELRTPLNAIGGYTDLLLLGVRGPVTPTQQDDLERVRRSQRHLLGLINDILNFARLEAGKVEFVVRPVSLTQVVADVEPLVAPQLAAKQIRFAASAEDVRVVADTDKVQQILLNLLSNAIKFTGEGGEIEVRAHVAGDVAHIDVCDTGVGIAADRFDEIFDPFVQVSRTLSQPIEGTGLGLAISRDLARGMNGEITVQSAPGHGSTFTVVLPLAR